jgi:glucose-1-phosphate adenylyltransferase
MQADGLAKDTMAVVLAGGKGTRLGPLTRHICKPALPFGAAYRNIDFTLSNCVNSDIRRIGVATQHKPGSLIQHIDAVWSKAVTTPSEFIEPWPAQVRAPKEGYRGTADAVFRNLDSIMRQDPRFVLVLAGDHVYKMDYRPMLEYHRRCRADVTVGCIEVDAREASQFGILSIDSHGRIEQFIEKPETVDGLPDRDHVLASMGIYVFNAPFLARVLRQDAFSAGSQHDFGKNVLPGVLRGARAFAYPFGGQEGNGAGYWRDVGTPAAYWRAHLELLDASPSLRLDDSGWPLPAAAGKPRLTRGEGRDSNGPAAAASLIGGGCEVGGVVNRSVVFSGVRVSRGAVIDRSVVLPGAHIGRNCRLSGVIVDSDCRIPDGTIINRSPSGDAAGRCDEPIVVTAEDFASDLLYSYA